MFIGYTRPVDWLVYLVIGIVAVIVWLFYGSRDHCPECGARFPNTLSNRIHDTLGEIPRYCSRCGWHNAD